MMEAIQYDLFEAYDENKELRKYLGNLEEGQHKLRRSLFARHTDLMKQYIKMNDKVAKLEWRLSLIEKNLSKSG